MRTETRNELPAKRWSGCRIWFVWRSKRNNRSHIVDGGRRCRQNRTIGINVLRRLQLRRPDEQNRTCLICLSSAVPDLLQNPVAYQMAEPGVNVLHQHRCTGRGRYRCANAVPPTAGHLQLRHQVLSPQSAASQRHGPSGRSGLPAARLSGRAGGHAGLSIRGSLLPTRARPLSTAQPSAVR